MNFTINHLGLIIDVAGAIILFRFGLPSDIINERGPFVVADYDDDILKAIQKRNRKIKLWAKAGIAN